eukprot:CAMPEP_0174269108 /NCGR_PEP_ID=MMETSP0439-20130205/39917_1 /TAXON_ID=0 /ORGANISM="Stereomyxa ramosa, Strain Chinc5" /LENGTH=261 /DNA_ID=CAMNT_0015357703 /DNA_START=253 /DNA_END=1035 /DNA_ORIENTATION=-
MLSGGNPQCVKELSQILMSAVVDSDNEAGYTFKSNFLQDMKLPDTILRLVISSIDKLPPSLQLVLKTASVAGCLFSLDIMTKIFPLKVTPEVLKSRLRKLLDHNILIRCPGASYRFREPNVQYVCYNLMTFEQKKKIHRAIANYYETAVENEVPGCTRETVAMQLALHLPIACDDVPCRPNLVFKALYYLVRASTYEPTVSRSLKHLHKAKELLEKHLKPTNTESQSSHSSEYRVWQNKLSTLISEKQLEAQSSIEPIEED